MKSIQDITINISDLRYAFGNPRKKNNEKNEIEEMKSSIEKYGVWRSIGIDEKNNVIFGNKLSLALKQLGIKQTMAKKLIGYTEQELRTINVKDNEHVGEWDFEILKDWDMGADIKIIPEEEIQTQEKTCKPYNKIHILLSIDMQNIDKVYKYLEEIKNNEYIEYEQSAN
jgi:hypothetical protein